jgi:hypothetical protein
MAGAGNGQEFGDALDDAEQGDADQVAQEQVLHGLAQERIAYVDCLALAGGGRATPVEERLAGMTSKGSAARAPPKNVTDLAMRRPA